MTSMKHVIYYIRKNLSGPPLKYNHEENISLVVVLAVQKLCHYILLRTTIVVVDSNPMHYLLSHRQINGKFSRWIIILQEYDLEFTTPKRKKSLILVELMVDLPSNSSDPPVNENFLDEHLFLISSDDPWYGDILVYLRMQKFALTSPEMTIVAFITKIHVYLLIGDVLYGGASTPFSDDVSPLKKQIKCSMIVTVEHVEVTFLACPLHKK
jgi:hypothetical protein